VEKEAKKPAAQQKPSVPLPVEKEAKKPAVQQKPTMPLPVEKEAKKPAVQQKPSVPLPVEKEAKKPAAKQKPSVLCRWKRRLKSLQFSKNLCLIWMRKNHLPSSFAEISEDEKPLRLPVDRAKPCTSSKISCQRLQKDPDISGSCS